MKILKIIILLITTILNQTSSAQVAPAIQWQNTIGGSSGETFRNIQQTSDGGYICGGWSSSDISGDKTENCIGFNDFWIVKIDGTGSIQWQKTIGGSHVDILTSIQQTSDGGYICGGISSSNISGNKTENSMGGDDFWVVKLNNSGTIEWQNTIGGIGQDRLLAIQQTSDGGYICGGGSSSDISGDKTENSMGGDFWVVKLNNSGTIEWQNTIGGDLGDEIYSIQQTLDGGYICGGASISNISGDKTEDCRGSNDFWVVKIDNIGAIQWQKTIGGSAPDQFGNIQQTLDGGYICGGYSDSNISGDKTENSMGADDYWVVKLDSIGSILWQNTIGGSEYDYLTAIQETSDGSYICVGGSNSSVSGDKTEDNQGDFDYWLLKLSNNGSIQWQNTIGGSSSDHLLSIQQSSDGGYICGGWSSSDISGDKTENNIGVGPDYWIVKLFPDTCTQTSTILNQAACEQFNLNGSIYDSSGTYIQVLNNVAGCDSIITLNLTIYPESIINVSASGNTTFCQGDSVILLSSSPNNNLWSPGGQTTASITVFNSGVYFVTIIDSNGCSAVSGSVNVVVDSLPIAVITPSDSVLICPGDSIQITASTNSNYLWNNGAATQSIIVYFPGIYFVEVINVNGCSATSDSVIVLYSQVINNQPIDSTVSVGNNVKFSVDVSDPAATFQWQSDIGFGFQNLSNAGQYSGVNNDTLTVSNATLLNNNQIFRCVITSGTCILTSDAADLTVLNNVSVNEVSDDDLFMIYPNPAVDYFYVRFNVINGNSPKSFELRDVTGRLLDKQSINNSNDLFFQTTKLASGSYSLRVLFNNGDLMERIINISKL